MSTHTTLAVDIGTATVTAATATKGEPARPLPVEVNGKKVVHYPAALPIDPDGELHDPGYAGEVDQWVTTPTRLLAQPPTPLGNTAYGYQTVFQRLLRPVMDQASDLSPNVTTIAVVVADHWPVYVVNALKDAIESLGVKAVAVPTSAALCAAATGVETPGAVTCLDMGETKLSITIAGEGKTLREKVVHYAIPAGGRRRLDAIIAQTVAMNADPQFAITPEWEKVASTAGRNLWKQASKADQSTFVFTMPTIGDLELSTRDVLDIGVDAYTATLGMVLEHPLVQNAWNVDDADGIAPTLLVAGGASAITEAATAVRASIGPFTATPHPETVAALGAAHLVAEGIKWDKH